MKRVNVSVVYALPDTATEIELSLPVGSSVADALRNSGILARHPEVNFARCTIGVFGRPVDAAALLAEGDRVEIYRPLIADPKETRKRRLGRRKRG